LGAFLIPLLRRASGRSIEAEAPYDSFIETI
jgi:hypothetical protein